MDAETLQIKWTCYICHTKAPEHSLASLEAQEKSKETEIFIDGDYRIYLRCPHCRLCFHATCAQYELELHLTKELRGTICEKCATDTSTRDEDSNNQPQWSAKSVAV